MYELQLDSVCVQLEMLEYIDFVLSVLNLASFLVRVIMLFQNADPSLVAVEDCGDATENLSLGLSQHLFELRCVLLV